MSARVDSTAAGTWKRPSDGAQASLGALETTPRRQRRPRRDAAERPPRRRHDATTPPRRRRYPTETTPPRRHRDPRRHILSGLVDGAAKLGTQDGYTGYGAEQGTGQLRELIAESCYGGTGIKASEVFVSDGAKCDISRLQIMFGPGVTSAVQDPSYPVYVGWPRREVSTPFAEASTDASLR